MDGQCCPAWQKWMQMVSGETHVHYRPQRVPAVKVPVSPGSQSPHHKTPQETRHCWQTLLTAQLGL